MPEASHRTREPEQQQASQYHGRNRSVVVLQALKEGRLKPQMMQPHEGLRRPGLSTLVLDEADLILSMPGYDEDLQQLAPKALLWHTPGHTTYLRFEPASQSSNHF